MFDTAYVLAFFFVFIRITAFFLASKIFFPKGSPKILKGVLAIIVSYAVVSCIDYSTISNIKSDYMIIFYMISETICGAILGFVVNLLFEMIRLAGSLMDLQLGLSMMNVVDPSSTQQATILSTLSYYMAIVIFFISNGHQVILKCLIKSFDVIPVAKGIAAINSFNVVLKTFCNYFEIGIRIALPVIMVVLICDIALSLISRAVPQLNVMILGIPIKITIGLLTLIMLLPITYKLLGYAFGTLDNVIQEVLKVMAACPFVFAFAKDDKTEEPTGKKLHDARKKGQVARSKDISQALALVICTLILATVTGMIGNVLKEVMIYFMQDGILKEINEVSINAIFINLLGKAAICIIPVLLAIAVGGILGNILQVGFLFTTEPLKPSLGKLNPINGFKNMFSKKALLDMIKNLLIVFIIGYIAYEFIVNNYNSLLTIGNIRLVELGNEMKKLVVSLFFKITLIMIIIAVADFVIQKRIFKKDMRMTKQEVKDEYKQMEGDPQIKNRIKAKQREIASRRMMESVPDATVVITNPTHLAIAIKYEDGKMEAPKVVAKGADLIAIKIKEIARENNVPIMENKPLARLMYEKVEINEEIPQDMYQAVAEILVMVYKLKNKRR